MLSSALIGRCRGRTSPSGCSSSEPGWRFRPRRRGLVESGGSGMSRSSMRRPTVSSKCSYSKPHASAEIWPGARDAPRDREKFNAARAPAPQRHPGAGTRPVTERDSVSGRQVLMASSSYGFQRFTRRARVIRACPPPAVDSAPMPPAIGSRVGPYEVLDLLGEGGPAFARANDCKCELRRGLAVAQRGPQR